MANRKVPFVSGEFYHIYNRGNSKQEIFLDENDYRHFMKCLFVCNTTKSFKFRDDIVDHNIDAFDFDREEPLVSIGAWVLMPNHFHLYLTFSHKSDLWEKKDKKCKNNISEFMRKLATSYTKYFNTRHNRTGSLYEGKFKSVRVKSDSQAKYLFSYIHLNPVKIIDSKWKEEGVSNTNLALEYLNAYKWSSYHDHCGVQRKENKILEINNFPKYFSKIGNFNSEILSWLQYE